MHTGKKLVQNKQCGHWIRPTEYAPACL